MLSVRTRHSDMPQCHRYNRKLIMWVQSWHMFRLINAGHLVLSSVVRIIMFHDKFVCLLSKPNIEFIEQIIFIKHGHDIDFDRKRGWSSGGVIDITYGANHAAVDEQTQSFCRKPWQHNQVPFAGRNREEFSEVTAIRGSDNGYQATACLNFEFHSTSKKGDETPIPSGTICELEPCGNGKARSTSLQVGATRAGTEVNGGSTGRCNSDDMGWKVQGVLH